MPRPRSARVDDDKAAEELAKELCATAASGDLARVKDLVEKHQVPVEPHYYYEERPTWKALENGRVEVLRYLLKKGADPEALWFEAAKQGTTQLLKALFAMGLKPGKGYEREERTALQTAVENGHEQAVKLLLGRGMDPNRKAPGSYASPLAQAAGDGAVALVRLLLAAGADPMADKGRALTEAAEAGVDRDGENPDCLACLKLLHKAAKFDVNASYDAKALLTRACEKGRLATAKWLLEQGADPDKAERGSLWNKGDTPIRVAALHGHTDVVRLLLERPLREDHRVEALRCAAFGKHRDIIDLLIAKQTPTDDPEVQKELKRAGVVPAAPAKPCNLKGVDTLFATLSRRPGGLDSMELLTRKQAREQGALGYREIGGLALPLIRLGGGDLIALRPLAGAPIAVWPVVHVPHGGGFPRTIAPNLGLVVPAWFAHQFDPPDLQARSGPLHTFFGGAAAELMMKPAELRRRVAGSPEHNPTAAAQMKKRLRQATAKELESYLFARDWYYDIEEAERILKLSKVAARLVAAPPSKAWLATPKGRAATALASLGDGYDGSAHHAVAEELAAQRRRREAFSVCHTAIMFQVGYSEFVPDKTMAAARRLGDDDARVKAVMAFC